MVEMKKVIGTFAAALIGGYILDTAIHGRKLYNRIKRQIRSLEVLIKSEADPDEIWDKCSEIYGLLEYLPCYLGKKPLKCQINEVLVLSGFSRFIKY